MLAFCLATGLLLLLFSCFMVCIERFWPHCEGTIVSKEERFPGSDSDPIILYRFLYKTYRGNFTGYPVFSRSSSKYNINVKLCLLIAPWNHNRFYVRGDRKYVVILIASALLLIVLIVFGSKI